MGEWDDPPLRFKVKGYNVSYVRYMQVWSLRGMGVCSGRCVEARIWGMRVCRSVILVARSYPTPHLTEILAWRGSGCGVSRECKSQPKSLIGTLHPRSCTRSPAIAMSEVKVHPTPAQQSPPGPPRSAKELAELVAVRARRASLQSKRVTPFSVAAKAEGYSMPGGKLDDVTVICVKVAPVAAGGGGAPRSKL